MPWSKMKDVPAQVKKHKGIPLTLSQANFVAKIADDSGSWSIAWSKFNKKYKSDNGRWIKR